MNVFLTGATGFLGEYLLAELLERGHRVWALYRDESKRIKTAQFLSDLGLNPGGPKLQWLKGDVVEVSRHWEQWEEELPSLKEVDHILHSAASLRFRLNSSGEPRRTNIGGAQALWELTRRRPMQVHLISTAYVCGLIPGGLVCEANHPRGNFANAYEESKWEAEQLWAGNATILRPSVIIGDSRTGRCTSFTGWYIIAKGAGKLISPQKIENRFLSDPLFNQVVVQGEGRPYLTALITLNLEQAAAFAREREITFDPPRDLLDSAIFCSLVDDRVAGVNRRLARFETIKAYTILKDELSKDGGELTISLKVRRKVIDDKFKVHIEAMYAGEQEGKSTGGDNLLCRRLPPAFT